MQKTRLEALLNAHLELNTAHRSQPIYAGTFSLLENSQAVITVLDQYAALVDNFPSYEQFKKLFDNERFTETEPKQADVVFQNIGHELNAKERQIKQLYFYSRAKVKHNKRFQEHQTLQKRAKAFTKGADNSFKGYLSCISNKRLTSDDANYPQPLRSVESDFFTSPHEFYIDEKNREKHTYITAASGHGKSVTLETLFNHYLTHNTDTAVILLDPHGDLAASCARLLPNKDSSRLVYIKPSHDRNTTPTLNPFDLPSKEWDTINKASDALIEVFKEVMQADGEGATFTPQMVTILKPCISTLLHMDNTGFVDLMRFLDDDPESYNPYLDYAKKVLTNPVQLDALEKDFMKVSFNPSKLGVKTKIRNLLNDDYFFNFLVGKSTINLKEQIDRKAVIVFDLSDLTEKSKDAIGRFIMANITTLAKSRGNQPYEHRTPIHLLVDECQKFVSQSMESILTETRKFRLHGTFAQQFTGQGMDSQMKKAIIGNSAVKITGNNGMSDLKIMAAETGVTVEEMQTLDVGEFFIQSGKGKSCVKVKMPFLEGDSKMTESEWKIVMDEQVDKYYRPIGKANNHKPQHTQKEKDSNTSGETNKSITKKTSGIQPHLKNRGTNLDSDPFK